MENKKLVRRLLYTALFDVETQKAAFSCPIVTAYENLEDNSFEINVRYEWGVKSFYSEKISMNHIKKYESLQVLYSQIKYVLNESYPRYDGECKITDLYISGHYKALMFAMYGIIGAGENENTPINY